MKDTTRLYRFYNVEKDGRGEPFSMCDACKENYEVPANCIMEKIADKSVAECSYTPHSSGGEKINER